MGYYTRFKISTMGKPFSEKEIKELELLKSQAAKLKGELKKIALEGIAAKEKRVIRDPKSLVKEYLSFNPFEGSTKWYEYDENMKTISKKYPETIFILEGEGEESGDIWKRYYLNGKVQVAEAKISYDEFDEKKLK